MHKNSNLKIILLALVACFVFFPDMLFASSTGLAWEGPLDQIVNSIKGPVAFGISIVAIIAAGVTLIFGGEIGTFMKTILFLVLVISLIVMATNILSTLFGTSGSLIIV